MLEISGNMAQTPQDMALIADKGPQATRKQAIDLQAAILAALRKRNGGTAVGEGAPSRWKLESRAHESERQD